MYCAYPVPGTGNNPMMYCYNMKPVSTRSPPLCRMQRLIGSWVVKCDTCAETRQAHLIIVLLPMICIACVHPTYYHNVGVSIGPVYICSQITHTSQCVLTISFMFTCLVYELGFKVGQSIKPFVCICIKGCKNRSIFKRA